MLTVHVFCHLGHHLQALFLLAAIAIGTVMSAETSLPEIDSDGDGLGDYLEIHKYRTDPQKPDSDDDGLQDGDWAERREFAYTIRTVVRVMLPVNVAAMQNDYQDAQELSRDADHVELEVIHYPLNTLDRLVPSAETETPAALAAWLLPGVVTRFDSTLRAQIVSNAARVGLVPPARWTAADVRAWSDWLLRGTRSTNDFTTYFVYYPDKRPAIFPGLEKAFATGQTRPGLSPDEQFDRELFGDSMFRNGERGTCTSSAVFIATAFRALGLPARLVLAVPAVDSSDPAQLEAVHHAIRLPAVRRPLLAGLRALGLSFSAHTFNEIYLDGRWRRLNYAILGQNILDRDYMGLLTHVNTFHDLSDLPLAATWGRRYAMAERSAVFAHSNPYATLEISESQGIHCALDSALLKPAPDRLRITRLYWFHSPERPASIPASAVKNNGDGHLLMHVEPDKTPVAEAYAAADKNFTLHAPGAPPLTLKAERGYWGNEFYLRLPAEEFVRMRPDLDYRLMPPTRPDEAIWQVETPLLIRKLHAGSGRGSPDTDLRTR